jgi:hypothetical protein
MRWNMVLGALVVSVGLSSQSFGFELLDRMLGLGCGCGSHTQEACCEKPVAKPACGCEKKTRGCRERCGLQLGGHLRGMLACRERCCKPKTKCCKPAPKPCCKPAPKPCCKPAPKPCCKPAPKPCCKAKPKCGCRERKERCRSGCGLGLLDIFQRNCGCRKQRCGGCDSCGGGHEGHEVEVGDEASPMPPAPTEDTSAMLPSSRRVLNVSSVAHN